MDQEMQKLLAMTEENNRMLHKMRRGVWWGRLFGIAWWLLVAAVSAAGYYYYVMPYINSILHAYQSAQHGVTQAQSFQEQIQQMFTQIFQQLGGSTATR